ncbi:chromosome segregation protein [Carpediemonas membranifera]|uniref:Chromosome segregation protein n=1 Tax=Carpediemonas membranifera TaxID=201153 RepID=A0A8J6ASS5_9EUKA|nr:chromosome segregation protein [Carpediemonas membranifera]|eukprot:KAG9393586.1 chromosome segregation protein [Carpediemonas membranifera]
MDSPRSSRLSRLVNRLRSTTPSHSPALSDSRRASIRKRRRANSHRQYPGSPDLSTAYPVNFHPEHSYSTRLRTGDITGYMTERRRSSIGSESTPAPRNRTPMTLLSPNRTVPMPVAYTPKTTPIVRGRFIERGDEPLTPLDERGDDEEEEDVPYEEADEDSSSDSGLESSGGDAIEEGSESSDEEDEGEREESPESDDEEVHAPSLHDSDFEDADLNLALDAGDGDFGRYSPGALADQPDFDDFPTRAGAMTTLPAEMPPTPSPEEAPTRVHVSQPDAPDAEDEAVLQTAIERVLSVSFGHPVVVAIAVRVAKLFLAVCDTLFNIPLPHMPRVAVAGKTRPAFIAMAVIVVTAFLDMADVARAAIIAVCVNAVVGLLAVRDRIVRLKAGRTALVVLMTVGVGLIAILLTRAAVNVDFGALIHHDGAKDIPLNPDHSADPALVETIRTELEGNRRRVTDFITSTEAGMVDLAGRVDAMAAAVSGTLEEDKVTVASIKTEVAAIQSEVAANSKKTAALVSDFEKRFAEANSENHKLMKDAAERISKLETAKPKPTEKHDKKSAEQLEAVKTEVAAIQSEVAANSKKTAALVSDFEKRFAEANSENHKLMKDAAERISKLETAKPKPTEKHDKKSAEQLEAVKTEVAAIQTEVAANSKKTAELVSELEKLFAELPAEQPDTPTPEQLAALKAELLAMIAQQTLVERPARRTNVASRSLGAKASSSPVYGDRGLLLNILTSQGKPLTADRILHDYRSNELGSCLPLAVAEGDYHGVHGQGAVRIALPQTRPVSAVSMVFPAGTETYPTRVRVVTESDGQLTDRGTFTVDPTADVAFAIGAVPVEAVALVIEEAAGDKPWCCVYQIQLCE